MQCSFLRFSKISALWGLEPKMFFFFLFWSWAVLFQRWLHASTLYQTKLRLTHPSHILRLPSCGLWCLLFPSFTSPPSFMCGYSAFWWRTSPSWPSSEIAGWVTWVASRGKLTWCNDFPRVIPDLWLVLISKWYISSGSLTACIFSVCTAFSHRRHLVVSKLTHFAPFVNHFFWMHCEFVGVCGCVCVCMNPGWRETPITSFSSKPNIMDVPGFHLIATVAMTPLVSLTVIIIMVTSSGLVLNVLAVTHIQLSSPL